MTLQLPWPEPQTPDENRDDFEEIAKAFPIQAANLANVVPILATTGTARKIDFGQATGNFPTANAMTALVVNHSLGTTPTAVVITQIGGALFGVTQFDAGTYTSTQFTINGNSTVVQNGNALLAWIAIG